MINNWSYLLFDHLNFWHSHFLECTTAIQRKLQSRGFDFPLPHDVRVKNNGEYDDCYLGLEVDLSAMVNVV